MVKKLMDKIKEGVSVQEVEDFARKYTTEVFSVLAILVGSISSMYDFFTGARMTIVFFAIGVIVGIFFPAPVEKGLKQFYNFSFKQEKTTQMVLGVVKLVVGLFIPFVLFGFMGLLAGTSYHYYTRHAQIMDENRPSKGRKGASGEEHD
ncbi:MAG: hypothetical protein KGR16_06490 [Verrucomicrobia bacterium]|nr:hypothetical protein [Verrucomicrobiota bacterium]MDE3047060.1 hypothetical protein [Verrucomicrobiota bacterium]